nr:immunoglobulin light chain junction region [Macaca mulatta]MOW11760.1 immunoglobulin light chain junction region [Macaca mulatta]MOW14515.1 immunoglobulin light chain junction region [Macaca mulatta]
CQQHSRYPWTF